MTPTAEKLPPLVEDVTDGARRGLRYHFHPGQLRAWDSGKRVVAVIAGARGGKTSFGACWLHREMCRAGAGDYLLAAPSYQLLEKAAAPEVEHLFGRLLGLGRLRRAPFRFEISEAGCESLWGAVPARRPRLLMGHADDPDSLEAMTLKAAWLDEAGQARFRLGSWEAVQRRLAVDRGRVLISSTPYSFGWLKQVLFDPWEKSGRDHPEIDVVTFDSLANPAFPRQEWERAQASMPAWRFDLYYRGRFSRPAGLIFDSFDTARHVVPRFALPDWWPRFLGLDFGNVNCAALFVALEPPTGRLYVYREYWPREHRSAAEHARALLAGEPMVPGAAGGSKQEEGWREAFRAAGLPVAEPALTGADSVEVGIGRVWAAFKQDRVYVFSDLAHFLDELGSYSREVDERGEPTEKIDGKASYHLCDAARYLLGHLAQPDDAAAGETTFGRVTA